MGTYLVDCGHTLNGADTGAEGNGYKEQNCTRDIGKYLKQFLEEEGNQTIFVQCDNATSENSSLQYRANKANQYTNAKLFISIHMNSASSPSANGTEVYISATGGQAEVYAKRIVNKISSIGYYNRGVKTANFYVLRKTIVPAVLVECCFISSPKDISLYDPKKIAKEIAEGILNKNITSDIPDKKPSIDNSNSTSSSNEKLNSGDICTTKNVSNTLNLRAEGTTNSKVLATINSGDTFIYNYVDSNYLGWLNVTYKGINGYVNSEYVRKKANATKYGIVTASTLNVRNGASTDSKVVGEVYKNEKVEIKWTETGWYYIEYNTSKGKKEGYVSAKYINLE